MVCNLKRKLIFNGSEDMFKVDDSRTFTLLYTICKTTQVNSALQKKSLIFYHILSLMYLLFCKAKYIWQLCKFRGYINYTHTYKAIYFNSAKEILKVSECLVFKGACV